MRFSTIEAFAAQRRTDQDDMEKNLFPIVAEAVKTYPAQGWYDSLLKEVGRLYTDTYHREGGKGIPREIEAFLRDVRDNLDKTTEPDDNTADRLSVWLATAILNAATMEAAGTDEEFVVMEWVTMHDDDVRVAHMHTSGQQRPPGEPFDVDGTSMRYPGDPTAPIELWINCRCSLAPTLPNEFTKATTEETMMTASASTDLAPTPFHAVLAPEGKWSGDGRSFAPGSLTFRDLPLPLSWQKISSAGHDGSVVVCKAEQIARVDGEMRATGHFLMIPEADEVVGLVAEFGKFGISVDADDAEFDYDEDSGKVEFTRARIASASIVTIPAFSEAYIALGDAPPGFMGPDDEAKGNVCDPEDPAYDEEACRAKADEDAQPSEIGAALVAMAARAVFVSEEAWDGSAGRFTDEQWKRSCVLHLADTLNKSDHKLPIREPGGALSRAGTHAAAARFNQVQAPAEAKSRAKSALRGAYSQLGEEPPDILKAADSTVPFISIAPGETEDGPGWLTHPVDTDRLRDYWVRGPGAAKIGWGTPGDFNRCRTNLAQYVKPQYLNGYCANRHKDALGIWPGEHHSLDTEPLPGDQSPAVSLVAAGGWCAPSDWFKNPELKELTPLTITEEGQVYGHVAGWKSCHAAFKMCVAPPHSVTGYAHFLTGAVLLDDGSQVAVGPITYGGGHAGPGGMRAAMAHYDDASTVVADVTCGEDDIGIWVAGWTRPGVDPAKVIGLRASPPSGDWRRDRQHDHLSDIGKAMEMIVVHSVNDPGYLIPRVGVENGEQVSLVAAGYVAPSNENDHSFEELVQFVADELTERSRRREQMAEVAARIGD